MKESTIKQYREDVATIDTESQKYISFIDNTKDIGTDKTKDIIKLILSNKTLGVAEKASRLHKLTRCEFQVKCYLFRGLSLDFKKYDGYENRSMKCSNTDILNQFSTTESLCATADKRIQMFMKAIDGLV